MIKHLATAIKLKARHNISDFFVSREVLQQVLKERDEHSRQTILLNMPHDSISYRFVHKVERDGMTFHCVTNERINLRRGRVLAGA